MSPRRMDPSVGASFGLSVLIVGVAAVALRPTRDAATLAVASPPEAIRAPTPTPVQDLPERPSELISSPPDSPPQPPAPPAPDPTHVVEPIPVAALRNVRPMPPTRVDPPHPELAPRAPMESELVADHVTSDSIQPPEEKSGEGSIGLGRVPLPLSRLEISAVRRPGSAFITSLPGETLADLAARVYGSADAVEVLWRANRDQLEAPDSPIRPGSLLRTP